MVKGKLIDKNRGVFKCPVCRGTWSANIKPDSNGKFEYGSQQCPYCK